MTILNKSLNGFATPGFLKEAENANTQDAIINRDVLVKVSPKARYQLSWDVSGSVHWEQLQTRP